jgi:hypothetical protein
VITATAADGGTVSITPATSVPGTATVTVTSEDGTHSATYTVNLVPTSTSADGGVGGTVPATLSLTLGQPASFGTFVPGVAHTYTAQTTVNVISTAGDAALTVADPDTAHPGHLVNGAYVLPQALQVDQGPLPATLKTWSAPVSNDPVAVEFEQAIGSGDALRTGSYAKTLTFTLSTDQP